MSVSKKIITSYLAIALTIPTIFAIESPKADAATGEELQNNRVSDDYNLGMKHWIKGHDLLKQSRDEIYSFIDKKSKLRTITLSKKVTEFQRETILEEETIDPNKEYLVSTEINTKPLGPLASVLKYQDTNKVQYLNQSRYID